MKFEKTKSRQFSLKTVKFPHTNRQIQYRKSSIESSPKDQHKKNLMNTQTLLNHKLPIISQLKQHHKNIAKQLSSAISKFQHYYEQESLTTSQQIIRAAMSVIKGFSQTQNNFQQLFVQLYATFKRFCFTLSQGELLSKYNIKQGTSFRQSCFIIERKQQKIMNTLEETINRLTRQNQTLSKQLQTKQYDWKEEKKHLIQQIQKYKKIANVEYVKSLERKIVVLKEQISEKIEEYTSLARLNEQIAEDNNSLKSKIQSLNDSIANKKAEIYQLRTEREKYDKYLNDLRDKFDDLLAKMLGLKEVIQAVQGQNEKLIAQRVKLINRAASGYENLTPRPKYSKIFNEQLEKQGQLNPTQIIMQKTLERYLPLLKDKTQKNQFIDEVIFMKKKYRLADAEKIREKTSMDIIKAKNKAGNLF